MKTNDSIRVKNMMYEQQIKHLPNSLTADNIFDEIGKRLNPKRYAVVVHDKDVSDDDTPAEEHIQAMMTFENARSLANVAKLLGDKPQYIEKWDERADNGFAYLIHRTEKAVGKYQYDVSSVQANFDYPALIAKMDKIAKKKKKTVHVNKLLDALKDGTVTMAEIERQFSGSQYGQYALQIARINALRLKKEAEAWRKQALAEGKTVRLIWIYGASGTGKSTLAKRYAKQRNEPFFVSGSSRDIFQAYSGQHTVILDELRPSMMMYSDLLRLTNPYSIDEETMAPSRYADKAIACDLFIVTSPYSPISYYENSHLCEYDSFAQLERRIVTTIRMTEDEIVRVVWDDKTESYRPVGGSAVPNSFSSKNYASPEEDAAKTYADLVAVKGGKG